jgi:hypothetical protein
MEEEESWCFSVVQSIPSLFLLLLYTLMVASSVSCPDHWGMTAQMVAGSMTL